MKLEKRVFVSIYCKIYANSFSEEMVAVKVLSNNLLPT